MTPKFKPGDSAVAVIDLFRDSDKKSGTFSIEVKGQSNLNR